MMEHAKARHKAQFRKKWLPFMGSALLAAPTLAQATTLNVKADEEEPLATVNTFATTESFIQTIAQSAQEIADANDLYASVMIAQAILESQGGNSSLSQAPYYNLFGIKGMYNGTSVELPTGEYVDDEWVVMNEPFRSYGSYWESLIDYANVLLSTAFAQEEYHYAGVWKRNTTSYMDATAWLTGTYATDPGYTDKLNGLIQTYNLTMYDTPTAYAPDEEGEIDAYASAVATEGMYRVEEGDSLWGIAEQFGLSLEELMAMNGLEDYTIYVGDVLKV